MRTTGKAGDTPTPAGDGKLEQKLQQQLTEGQVSISSSDMAAASKEDGPAAAAVEGPTLAEVPAEANADNMMNRAAGGEPGQALSDISAAHAADEQAATEMAIADADDLPEQVEITDAERDSFLEALVSGNRYSQQFTLFAGKVEGVFRCRTQQESQGIISQLNRECQSKNISNALEYSTRLRNTLLAAQISRLQDEEFVELPKPLMQTVDGEKVTPPGWLANVEVWDAKDEGLVSALYNALQLFEKKYWTMVRHADDQNFWNPAESTSE